MVWAFMERELDKIRHTFKNIDELKRKVHFIWNRIPKRLCRRIINRFKYMLEIVLKNNGHKENRKDRRDKKPLFKLSKIENDGINDDLETKETTPVKKKIVFKKQTSFKIKYFEEYDDKITRIAYSTTTMIKIKEIYQKFLNKEVAFLKKVNSSIGII